MLSAQEWAREQFDCAELGDERRTRRAVAVAAGIALRPRGSIPVRAQTNAGSKAAYRFFDENDVTFEALTAPHFELTRQDAARHRRGDGDPGWITLWRGWQQLELLVAGANLSPQIERKCG